MALQLDPKNLAYAGLSAVAVAYALVKIREYAIHSSAAKAKGCKPLVGSASSEFTGISIIRVMLRALHDKRFPIWSEEEFDQTSELCGRQVDTMALSVPLFDTAILTRDPRNVQAMLATSFKDYGMGEHRSGNFAALLGNSIFASDGKYWEHSRALVRPQFSRTQISDLDMAERHITDLMQILDRSLETDGWTSMVDLRPLFFNFTMDTATEFLFGESVHCQIPLEDGDAEIASQAAVLSEALDAAQLTISAAQTLGPHYWVLHNAAFRKNVAKVHAFADHFVQKALALGGEGKKKEDFDSPNKFIFLNELAEVTQDPIELRSQLLSILFAGRDTTASALGWLWYVLAKPENKAIFERLRSDVIDTFGTYDTTDKISFESLKGCRYLQWCINEVQRMYPIVTYNNRLALRDTTLPFGGGPDGKSPLYIRKGQAIEYSIYAMHRRRDLWGEDANEFRPERWEKHRPGWEYLPFSGGPRVCIGQQFALTEIGYVMVRMLQRIDAVDGSELGPPRHDLNLIDTPVSVKLKMHFVY